jgi:hypothetical protein
MSSELERRLETLFAEAPEPEPGAGEKALHRALRALHPVATPRRGLRAAVVVFAAAVVLLAIAAASLGAAGALHVSLGTKTKLLPTMQLTLPRGANGILALVDGRLSVVTKPGFRLQGLPASAAALSPHALFVAAGIGNSLVAMAPDARRAWSHPAGGKVVAIAWAPDGFRIAYVVHAGQRFVLRTIYGNGTHDAIVDRSVRPVEPSWRADSLAFAYVGAGGKAIVYDLGHLSRRVVAMRANGDVRQVAFAPHGKLLAVATRTQVGTLRLQAGSSQVEDHGQIAGIGWTGRWLAVAHGGPHPVVWLTANPQLGSIHPGGRIAALGADGHGIALAVSNASGTRVLAAVHGDRVGTVLRLPRQASIRDLQLG